MSEHLLKAQQPPSVELADSCRHGDYKRVRALLVAGVDVHTVDACGGFAPLTIAAIQGHPECVRALLEAGADAGLATGGGVTALMYAAYDGHVGCVRALLDGGANVETADGADFTAVIYAAMQGHVECLRALIAAGADVGHAGQAGVTALVDASWNGHADCVRALLAAGADVRQTNREGVSALMGGCCNGHTECVRALLEAGAEVGRADEGGRTALIDASKEGHVACVELLLAAGANVAQRGGDGFTALMGASWGGHAPCARALLEAGAEVLSPDAHGQCALHWAYRHLPLVQLLCAHAPARLAWLQMPDDTSAESLAWLHATRRWSSPLHHFGLLSLERVRALLGAGADLDASDGEPRAPTPLSLARAALAADPTEPRALLIARAAGPWTPATHALYPPAARAYARELLLVGALLARARAAAGALDGEAGALGDAWLGHVMARAVRRDSACRRTPAAVASCAGGGGGGGGEGALDGADRARAPADGLGCLPRARSSDSLCSCSSNQSGRESGRRSASGRASDAEPRVGWSVSS